MEMFLLKSGICLAIFYGFYKLFLENESMHVFKRFYLLGALGISFLTPLITFTTYLEIPVTTVATTPDFVNAGNNSFTEIETATKYWPFVLWSLYGLGVFYFSIQFGRNLKNIFSRIKNNPKLKRETITHVLLKYPVVPHTFFSYVFLNKQKYEAQEIPEEVLEHEYVHANQKHSIDILLVELLQIIFWFNPILYFIKGSIKLNHEFLADRAVLNRGTDTVAYQNILLAFSSDATTPTLANSINYSFIKKRFTVMKKQTSTQTIWLRSLLVLPLVAILIFGFSSTEVIQKEVVTQKAQPELQQEKATKTEVEEYNKLAIKYNTMARDTMRIFSSEVDKMKFIYNKMTAGQKESAELFPNLPAPPPSPPAPPTPSTPNFEKDTRMPPLPAPAPPAPLSDPIEYIKALHKSGAVFYIGPHQYDYEKVLEMAKKSTDLNIDISEYPKVNLLGC